ncbi:MAG: M18 family aminopeptidase [SAR324 cluster bacterium]|nr:M18 family aminopeptidase [SAR324 cluster bacterium]
MKKLTKTAVSLSENLMGFIDDSPTPFHAVQNMSTVLKLAGFEELKEKEQWEIKPGNRYFVTREDASIAAWITGSHSPARHGFRIVGAHTDSPNLKIKPNPDIQKEDYQQLGVEVYGGVLLSSWADRDLSLAGRVITTDKNNKTLRKLFLKVDRAVLRIPLLCVHLNRDVNTLGLILNPQKHLAPVFGLKSKVEDPLRRFLSKELKTEPDQIVDYDLSLYDVQKSNFLGLSEEFVAAPRLDNLFSCFCGLEALLALNQKKQPFQKTCMMVAFDNEEIGSLTTQGARSSFLKGIINRINHSFSDGPSQAYERSLASSVFLSADMAHALHPNYPERHDPQHFPRINGGPVIKINAQGRYATSGYTSAAFQLICKRRRIPFQKFVNRTDLACGSTIGPFVASDLGIPSLDVGAAQLSMHSIREMCGSADAYYMIEAFKGFYEDA